MNPDFEGAERRAQRLDGRDAVDGAPDGQRHGDDPDHELAARDQASDTRQLIEDKVDEHKTAGAIGAVSGAVAGTLLGGPPGTVLGAAAGAVRGVIAGEVVKRVGEHLSEDDRSPAP